MNPEVFYTVMTFNTCLHEMQLADYWYLGLTFIVHTSLLAYLTQKLQTVASNQLNTDLVIIPGGMNSQLQIVDVVVNKPLKD
jgi:hypothetical protein